MKKYKHLLLLGVLTIIITPTIASAVWWNPWTWFSKKIVAQPVSQQQIEPVIAPKGSFTETAPKIQDSALVRPWADMEADWFAKADANNWTSLTIDHVALGEKRYYKKENGKWVRKNNAALSPVITSPMAWELEEFAWLCKQTPALCTPEVKEAFNIDPNFRYVTLAAISKGKTEIQKQQTQKSVQQEKDRVACLMEPTPPELRTLSPQQQQLLREQKCGVSTSQSSLEHGIYEQQQDIASKLKAQQKYLDCLVTGSPSFYIGSIENYCKIYKPASY